MTSNFNKYLIPFIVFFSAISFSFNAISACSVNVKPVLVATPPPTVLVDSSTPIGSVIGSFSASFGFNPITRIFTNCVPNPTQWGFFGTTQYLGNNIYATNVPGIGIKMNSTTYNFGFLPITTPSWLVYSNVAYGIAGDVFKFQLIKIGPVPSSGVIPAGDLACAGYWDNRECYQYYRTTTPINIISTNPICDVKATPINVDLGTVARNILSQPGSSSSWVKSKLELINCSNSTKGVTISVSGEADLNNPNNFINKGTAKNVSINVIDSDTGQSISNGSNFKKVVVNRSALINFDSRMYSSVGATTSGSVSGMIVFSLTYN